MSVVIPHKAIERVANSVDPKRTILEIVGDLSGLTITGDMVLMATYIRPTKTSGGIIRPDINVQEDVWQGKVGLVLKWGNTAYQDTPDYIFHEKDKVYPEEWGIYKVGDAWSMNVRGVPCRLVRDINIRAKVDDPLIVL